MGHERKVNSISGVNVAGESFWVTASKKFGLELNDFNGKKISGLDGKYEFVDTRVLESGVVVATTSVESGEVVLSRLNANTGELKVEKALSAPEFQVDALCLFQDANDNVFLYLVDGYGGGEHRWIYSSKHKKFTDVLIRELQLPRDVTSCDVNDKTEKVYFAEERIGVWEYPAAAEAVPDRELILNSPSSDIKSVVSVEDSILVSQTDTSSIAVYSRDNFRQANMQFRADIEFAADKMAILKHGGTYTLAILDDISDSVHRFPAGKLVKPLSEKDLSQKAKTYPEVSATIETQAVDRRGDAADDPAIWINRQNPLDSRVLGTNKKMGLLVYNLKGELLQTLPVGHINNVDLRQGIGDGKLDIAVASNRSDNSITVFKISDDGVVSVLGHQATDLTEVYGICLYQHAESQLFVLINDKDGRYQQIQLHFDEHSVTSNRVAEFLTKGQPEGCVADDTDNVLFVGEEEQGVWRFTFDENTGMIQTNSARLIATVGNELQADVEGLALYKKAEISLLVVSSQGDNSYALYETEAPYNYLGSFRVGLNEMGEHGLPIDGTTETDGLEVSSANFGFGYEEGLLVIQDGHNLMPAAPQNFKYIPWSEVNALLIENN